MQLHIHYTLSEIGQKAAIAAGLNAAKKQTVVVEAPPAALDAPGVRVDQDGSVHANDAKSGAACCWTGDDVHTLSDLSEPLLTYDAFAARVNVYREAVAKEKAKEDARKAEKAEADRKYATDRAKTFADAKALAEKYSAAPYEPPSSYQPWEGWVYGYAGCPDDMPADVAASITRAREAKDAFFAALNAKRTAEDAAAAARKHAQLDAAVAKYGTPSQKARWKDGVLDNDEAAALIEAAAFAVLDSFSVYKKLTKTDLKDHSDECTAEQYGYEPGVAWKVTEEDVTLNESEYERYSQIRSAMQNAKVEHTLTLRRHSGECKCDDCFASITRAGVRVRITIGEFSFSREYAL